MESHQCHSVGSKHLFREGSQHFCSFPHGPAHSRSTHILFLGLLLTYAFLPGHPIKETPWSSTVAIVQNEYTQIRVRMGKNSKNTDFFFNAETLYESLQPFAEMESWRACKTLPRFPRTLWVICARIPVFRLLPPYSLCSVMIYIFPFRHTDKLCTDA